MKILITGTAGFIGHHCAIAFADQGYDVVGLDNINDYYDPELKIGRLKEQGFSSQTIHENVLVQSNKHPSLSFVKMDLANKDQLTQLFQDQHFDYVCHLAAQAGVRYSIENPDVYIQSNIVGFLNILENCRHNAIKHLVFASSSSVYGLNQEMPFEPSHHTDHPISLYAATKKSNEMMAHAYAHLYNIPTTGLRFFTVYGPWGRPDMAPFLFTDAAFANRTIKVFNNGDMFRDFTYVNDIAEEIIRLVPLESTPNPQWDPMHPDPSISSAPYQIFNIGNHTPVQLLDFINAIEKSVGLPIQKEFLPMQPGDVQATYANIDTLIAKTGFTPNTPLSVGVEKFVQWYKDFYITKSYA